LIAKNLMITSYLTINFIYGIESQNKVQLFSNDV